MAVALLLAGCDRKKPTVLYDERDGGTAPFVRLLGRKSSLPPPKGKDPPVSPPAGIVARGRILAAASERARLSPPQTHPREPMTQRFRGEPLRSEASRQAAPGPGGPPLEEADPRGDPEARRPDELTALPTDHPQRYSSPAPLKRLLNAPRTDDRPMADVAPCDEDAVVDVSAAPASFPAQSTAPLDDEVPDSVVADPSELGSYHVQVSSSIAFAAILFNKEYEFMASIDLKTDLMALDVKPGEYWIRYAVVDLLGFEHPFTKPQRLLLHKQHAR